MKNKVRYAEEVKESQKQLPIQTEEKEKKAEKLKEYAARIAEKAKKSAVKQYIKSDIRLQDFKLFQADKKWMFLLNKRFSLLSVLIITISAIVSLYLPIRKNNEILKASSVQFMFSSNYENILTCTPINNSKDEFKLKCHYGPRKNSTGNVITSTGTITNAQSHLVDKKPLQQEQKDAVKSVNASKGFFDRIIKRPIKRLRQKILSKRIKKDNSATK